MNMLTFNQKVDDIEKLRYGTVLKVTRLEKHVIFR